MKLKLLTPLLLIVSTLPSFASDLPPCPKDQTQTYHNCFGASTYVSGGKYVGEYEDDKFNGKGIYIWTDGKKYVGEWKDGKRNGKGAITNPYGGSYEGEWKDGKFHGKGILTFADGEVKSGKWAGDTLLYLSPSFGGWSRLGGTKTSESYIDFERIRKVDEFTYFWTLQDYKQPLKDPDVLSAQSYLKGDCNAFRFKMLDFWYWDEHRGQGEITRSEVKGGDEDWVYPPPNSMWETTLKIACSK